jgi:hypothetical protein
MEGQEMPTKNKENKRKEKGRIENKKERRGDWMKKMNNCKNHHNALSE